MNRLNSGRRGNGWRAPSPRLRGEGWDEGLFFDTRSLWRRPLTRRASARRPLPARGSRMHTSPLSVNRRSSRNPMSCSLPPCGGGSGRGVMRTPQRIRSDASHDSILISECWVPPSPPSPTRGEGAENHHLSAKTFRSRCVNPIAACGARWATAWRDRFKQARSRLSYPCTMARIAPRNSASPRSLPIAV